MKRILFFALAVLAFASCNKDMLDTELQPVQSESREGGITIRATIAGDQTKTTVVYGNTDFAAGEISQWSEGDAFSVDFFDGSDWVTYADYMINPNDKGKTTAEFTKSDGNLPGEGTYTVRGFYPASAYMGIDFTGQTQTGYNADHTGEYDVMTAGPQSIIVDSDGNAEINMTFRHVLPMLRFRLKNATGADINITAIKIRSENAANQFYRSARYDYENGVVILGSPLTEVGLTCESTIVVNEDEDAADFYMMLAGNTVSDTDAGLIIAVHFGSGDIQEFVIPACDFLKVPFVGGMRYYFNLTVSGANITNYTDPVTGIKYELKGTTARLTDGTGASGPVVIPATVEGCNVTSIGTDAFWGSGITGLTFEADSQLADIGSGAFYFCSGLVGNITIPASVTSIGTGAFADTGITGLTFETGSQLAGIGDAAFSNCSYLVGNITIPASVTSIGGYAFVGAGITTINMDCTTPPTLGTSVFSGLTLTINVPSSAATTYNSVVNGKLNGWDHSSGTIDLSGGLPVSLLDLGGATSVTITAIP